MERSCAVARGKDINRNYLETIATEHFRHIFSYCVHNRAAQNHTSSPLGFLHRKLRHRKFPTVPIIGFS
jgi:hypothetical protein